MKITAVTTFHQEGMLTYGQRLIDSWQEKVDSKIKLIVYAEDCDPQTNGTNVRKLHQASFVSDCKGLFQKSVYPKERQIKRRMNIHDKVTEPCGGTPFTHGSATCGTD